ncbi:hypothetical protein L2E82_45543 [Cichorium intybus]|uniref:Uncharacterized protein n=1 Tax=Cichorium intybus TaxID=13427 RepID=A0ACB8ZTL6_CICIN|nr:hypothetical protein L2E82_45543 [Cichorium intybus]
MHMVSNSRIEGEETYEEADELIVGDNIPTELLPDANVLGGAPNASFNAHDARNDEAFIGLHDLICFGPFPSLINPIPIVLVAHTSDIGCSLGKWRRLDNGLSRLTSVPQTQNTQPRAINLESNFFPEIDPLLLSRNLAT